MKLRREDQIVVTAGKDRGKKGRILAIYPAEGRALVEGINLVKRHVRRTQDNPQGGFANREQPISLANLARVCGRCNRPVRVGFVIAKDGTKQRVCRRCGEAL